MNHLPPQWRQKGQTYSMARAIGLPHSKKVHLLMHYLRCHSQWKSLVTWTDFSNGHILPQCKYPAKHMVC